ncbi:MAG: hypothetical protein WKF71_14800 [Pyrinomonadaceae bacterium]
MNSASQKQSQEKTILLRREFLDIHGKYFVITLTPFFIRRLTAPATPNFSR